MDAPHTCSVISYVEKDIPIDDAVFKSYIWYAKKATWKGRIVFVHGYRDLVELYYEFGEFLAINGYDFFFYYQYGEGETKLRNGAFGINDNYHAYKAVDNMIQYNLDELKKNKYPETNKLHLMGLSMGGGITLNYIIKGKFKDFLKSAVIICPLITLHRDTYPGAHIEYIVRFINMFDWGKKLRVNSPLKVEYVVGDPTYREFLSSRINTEGLDGAFVETRDFILRGRDLLKPMYYSKIDVDFPVLICHGEDDHINNAESSKIFIDHLQKLKMKNKVVITYPMGKHNIIVDTKEIRDKVMNDILDFLNKYN